MVEIEGERLLERRAGRVEGEEKALRLAIADPHQLFRDCLAEGLAGDGEVEVTGKFASAEEALAGGRLSGADILLIGVEPPSDGALGLVADTCLRHPGLKVILLGREGLEERVLDFFLAGASGYLVRDQSLTDLRAAIDAVARGEIACTPRVAHSLFSRLAALGHERRRRERLGFLSLSPRELEILRFLSQDLSNQEIATRLILSVHTVKNHVHKILETLGVSTRGEAVRYAIERGWLKDRRLS
jgi:two-component system nitrate/nitrite response regulator NarL